MHCYFRKKNHILKVFSVNPQEDSTCNSQSYSKEKGDILRAGKTGQLFVGQKFDGRKHSLRKCWIYIHIDSCFKFA